MIAETNLLLGNARFERAVFGSGDLELNQHIPPEGRQYVRRCGLYASLYAAEEGRKSCLDPPVPADFGDLCVTAAVVRCSGAFNLEVIGRPIS